MASRSFGWTYRPTGEPLGQPTTFFRPVSIWEKHRLAGFDPPVFDQWGDVIPPEVVARQRKRDARRKKQEADYRRGGPMPRGRTKARGAKPSSGMRGRVIKRDGEQCRYCGARLSQTATVSDPMFLTLDHIVPRVLGGKNRDDNLVVCCQPCNTSKSDRLLGQATDGYGNLMRLRPLSGQQQPDADGGAPTEPEGQQQR